MKDNEELIGTFLQVAEGRFAALPKDTLILDYAEFMKTIGIWYWNQNLIQLLKTNFEMSMVSYNENTICRLIKLIAYNYQKDED